MPITLEEPDFSLYPTYPGEEGKSRPSTTSGRSRSSTQYKQPTGSRTISKVVFPGEAPTLDLPERDPARVRALTRKALAPRLRNLRTALNRALVRGYENPNVRRMIVREALQGYGQGLEEARYGAERTAEQQEAQERATAIQEALANYQGAMQRFLASGRRVTESRNMYDSSSGGYGGEIITTGWNSPYPLRIRTSPAWVRRSRPPDDYFEL